MKKITSKSQKYLKTIHLFFAATWLGGAFSLTLLNFFLKSNDGKIIYGINLARQFIDYFIIIPGALGCLFTGIAYGILTNWGWFKHNWLIGKWVITLFGIVFGSFWLGPWIDENTALSQKFGEKVLNLPQYIQNEQFLYFFGAFQFCTLLFALYLSVIKPWKSKRRLE